MRNNRGVAVVGLVAAMAAAFGLTAASASNTLSVCSSSCDYTTIQAAVNAASSGDTIVVAAGSHPEDVTVAKALTIQGAQAGTDARSRSGSESTVSSFHVTASNVVVDGFTLTNAGAQFRAEALSGPALSGIVVKNDIFSGYSDVAVPTTNAGNILLQNDLFESPTPSSESIQIKADSSTPSGCNGAQVKDSKFVSATNNSGADVNFSCTGSDSSGIVVSGNASTGDSGGSSLVGLSGITGGSITGNTATTDGSVVFVFGDVTGVLTLSGNAFTSTSGNALSVHAGDSGTSDPINTGTIDAENNTLSGGSHGVSVAAGALGPAAHVKAHGNVITGGAANASGITVDASDNWWGSSSQPSSITGVTTTPWCTVSDCSISSDDAVLTALSVSGGSLSPSFASSTTSYGVSLGNAVTSVTLTLTPAPGATAVSHGTTNSLAVGSTTVTIDVTSADATATQTYTVVITRAAPATTTTTTTAAAATTTTTSAPPPNVPASAPAAPGKSGSVAVAVTSTTATSGPAAPPVTIAVTWAPQTFTQPVTVQVTPTTLTSIATLQPGGGSTAGQSVPVGGGFSIGSTVIELNITTDAGAAVTSFSAPMVLHISAGQTKQVPAYSEDGTTWTTIPKLGSPALPEGQKDGYYLNTDGSIDVYTRHATYYALVEDTQAPTAPTLHGRITATTLRLSWHGLHDNVRIASYVVRRNGRGYKATKRTIVVLPRKPGRYVVVALDAAGNVSTVSHTFTVTSS
jgi:hypothetical protein